MTKSGTVTYKATVNEGASKFEQPLTNYVELNVDTELAGHGGDSAVYVVASQVKGETSQPTAPPTDTAGSVDMTVPPNTMQLVLVMLAGIALFLVVVSPSGSTRRPKNH